MTKNSSRCTLTLIHIHNHRSAPARKTETHKAEQRAPNSVAKIGFWHRFHFYIYIIILDKMFKRFVVFELLTFALAGINGLPLSFQHKSGRGSPLTIHSSLIVSPMLANTFLSVGLNSGRTIRRSLIKSENEREKDVF